MAGSEKVHRHRHHSTSAKGLWLELIESAASSMKSYDYCLECGAIKESIDPGRKNEFFYRVFAHLKNQLEEEGCKLTESQSRLIVKRISSDSILNDPFSATFDSQMSAFLEIVKDVRSDVTPERVKRAMKSSM